MGNPNTGEIYEGLLRNDDDVPLTFDQAAWLKSLPIDDRIKRLKEMQMGMREAEAPTRPMPRYKCHKEVSALKIANIQPPENRQRPTIAELEAILDGGGNKEVTMTPDGAILAITGAIITPAEDGYAPFQVGPEYFRKHKPQIGGYFVQYEDGYQSYSPAKAFEEGYTRL